jgi:hypothetical protein
MVISKARKEINDVTRDLGNKATPKFIEKFFGGGLGDVLASDVNLRKTGAVVGLVAPGLLAYAIDGEMMTALYFTLAVHVPGFCSIVGYGLGSRLDELRGDDSRRAGLYGSVIERPYAQQSTTN